MAYEDDYGRSSSYAILFFKGIYRMCEVEYNWNGYELTVGNGCVTMPMADTT